MPAKISDVNGNVRIQTTDGKVRDAKNGDNVNDGDKVITGKGSSASVNHTDGGITKVNDGTHTVAPNGGGNSGTGVAG